MYGVRVRILASLLKNSVVVVHQLQLQRQQAYRAMSIQLNINQRARVEVLVVCGVRMKMHVEPQDLSVALLMVAHVMKTGIVNQ